MVAPTRSSIRALTRVGARLRRDVPRSAAAVLDASRRVLEPSERRGAGREGPGASHEVPPADTAAALERGVEALAAEQWADGRWEAEVVWCAMLPAQYVLLAHVVDIPIGADRRRRILRQFERTRLPSGVWGLHDHAPPNLFVTTLVYVAARLLDVEADDPLLAPARAFIRQEGGASAIPTWGKFWLAMLGLYEWRGVNPVLPELWTLPSALPVHPSKFYCHTRMIYMAMSVVWAERVRIEPGPRIRELREELFPEGWDRVDWDAARETLRPGDLYKDPHPALRGLYLACRLADRAVRPERRRRLLSGLREQIRWELRVSDHTSISPVSGFLNLIALCCDDPDDPDLKRGLEHLEGWIWEDDEEGFRVTGARSQSWDTGFALQALGAAGRTVDVTDTARRGAAFLASQQIRHTPDGYRWANRIDPRGGYCFAGVWHGWPVSDCTAEAVEGLMEAPGYEPDPEQLREGAAFILRTQNRDGGFGSYEPKRPRIGLEWLNPAEMFGDSMTEASYIECTASCIDALVDVRRRLPDERAREIDRAVRRAERHLRKRQNRDGTWPGAWGIHYIYGTLFGIRGLRAAGATPDDPAIRRARGWLKARQWADGGWGEHHDTTLTGRYTPHEHPQVIQTAWALMALLEGGETDDEVLDRGARYLAHRQGDDGRWPGEHMVGVFFHTALLDYRLYKQYFPVWALGLYESRRRAGER